MFKMRYLITIILLLFGISCNTKQILSINKIDFKQVLHENDRLYLCILDTVPFFCNIENEKAELKNEIINQFKKYISDTFFLNSNGLVIEHLNKSSTHKILKLKVSFISEFITKKSLDFASTFSAHMLNIDSTYYKKLFRNEMLNISYIFLVNVGGLEYKSLLDAYKQKKPILIQPKTLGYISIINTNYLYSINNFLAFNFYNINEIDFKELYTFKNFIDTTFKKYNSIYINN